MIGPIGHLLILAAFVATGAATWFYYGAARSERGRDAALARGRKAWTFSFAAMTGASALLLYLIFNRQFQYNYVYSYTSNDLGWFYTLSAFWAGQEGSFLLWILCVGGAGLFLTRRAGTFEAPVMAVVGLCQLFLVSMVVGLKLGGFSLGVSPFMLLAERYPDAAALQQPGFVPEDGSGLNDLLQNPWMVIHPPVLFVGFAVMLVPFAYAVAGLWQKRYTEWVRPALPWTIFANLALMAGIALGGYWAYITLSFGGYWAWDPVENSSFVPWLVSVGALHTMISQKTSGAGMKASFLLNIAAFLLVIYSTFLTRSGVLGDTSVHSFTDLGLYNQLLLWILTLGAIGLGLFVRRHRELPVPQRELHYLSREFMIFSGAMLLAALGAVILVGTSAPILGGFFRDNPATVDTMFYNKWSLPLATAIALVAGMGPIFWWRKMTRAQVGDVLFKPMLFSTVCTVVVLLFTPFVEKVVQPAAVAQSGPAAAAMLASGIGGVSGYWTSFGVGLLLLLLVFAGFFALYGNGVVLWRVGRGNPRMAGGAVSHVGLVLMLFGIVTTSVFNNPLSDQRAGEREVIVLDQGVPATVEGYRVEFTGTEVNAQGRTSYHVSFTDPQGRRFEVRPVAYVTRRGQWMQSPDTKHFLEKDVYVAVSPSAMFQQHGGGQGQLDLVRGDSATIGGTFRLRFDSFDLEAAHPSVPDSASIVVGAVIEATNLTTGERRTLRPVYYMGAGHTVGYVPDGVEAWGLGLTLVGMQVDGGAVRLAVEGAAVPEREWVVVQAYEKPFINLLWAGLIVMLAGFVLATVRRAGEQERTPRNRKDDAPA